MDIAAINYSFDDGMTHICANTCRQNILGTNVGRVHSFFPPLQNDDSANHCAEDSSDMIAVQHRVFPTLRVKTLAISTEALLDKTNQT